MFASTWYQDFLSEVNDLPVRERAKLGDGALAAVAPSVNTAFERMDEKSVLGAYQVSPSWALLVAFVFRGHDHGTLDSRSVVGGVCSWLPYCFY